MARALFCRHCPQAEGHFGRPGPGPVIAAKTRGVDAVMIYNVAARSNFGIAVQQDSDIQDIEGLRGKVIGTGTADGAEVVFARQRAGRLGFDRRRRLHVPAGRRRRPCGRAAFLSGEVEAYAGAVSDAATAILNQRGIALLDITPAEFGRFFGNGYRRDCRVHREATPKRLIEAWSRAWIARGHALRALDPMPTTRAVLKHLADGNPQEGEDKANSSCAARCRQRSKTLSDSL